MNRILTGQFCLTAGGRQSYDIAEAEADFIWKIAPILEQLGWIAPKLPIYEDDKVFLDFQNTDGVVLTLSWDNWSGCFLFARHENGDAHVLEIGRHLDAILPELQEL